MDEVMLRKSLVKLRERDGLTVRKIRADPWLASFLGTESPTEAVQNISRAVSELDTGIHRAALEAAYAIEQNGDSTLSQRYTDLSKRTNRAYETIRKDSDEAVEQLTRLLLEKQAEAARANQNAERGRVLPGIVMRPEYTSFKSSFGPSIVASVDQPSYNNSENLLKILLKVEVEERIMWLIKMEVAKNRIVARLFQRKHVANYAKADYMHQASFVGSRGGFLVTFEMPVQHYVQRSDSNGGWHSTIERVQNKSATRIVYPRDGEGIRYFTNHGDAVDWDRMHGQ